MDEWISTKDKLPEKGQYILMCVKSEPDYTLQTGVYGYCDSDDEYGAIEEGFCFFDPDGCNVAKPIDEEGDYIVTHWMPLPKPPKGIVI